MLKKQIPLKFLLPFAVFAVVYCSFFLPRRNKVFRQTKHSFFYHVSEHRNASWLRKPTVQAPQEDFHRSFSQHHIFILSLVQSLSKTVCSSLAMSFCKPWSCRRFTRRWTRQSPYCNGEATHTTLVSTRDPYYVTQSLCCGKNGKNETNSLSFYFHSRLFFHKKQTKDKKMIQKRWIGKGRSLRMRERCRWRGLDRLARIFCEVFISLDSEA